MLSVCRPRFEQHRILAILLDLKVNNYQKPGMGGGGWVGIQDIDQSKLWAKIQGRPSVRRGYAG